MSFGPDDTVWLAIAIAIARATEPDRNLGSALLQDQSMQGLRSAFVGRGGSVALKLHH